MVRLRLRVRTSSCSCWWLMNTFPMKKHERFEKKQHLIAHPGWGVPGISTKTA